MERFMTKEEMDLLKNKYDLARLSTGRALKVVPTETDLEMYQDWINGMTMKQINKKYKLSRWRATYSIAIVARYNNRIKKIDVQSYGDTE